MKKILTGLLALTVLVGCKKPLVGGDCDVPPSFFFTLADSSGKSLLTSADDVVTVSYSVDKQPPTSRDCAPVQLPGSSFTGYLCADGEIAQRNVRGVHTFYLRFQGKTDTLGLQLQDKCGYNPAATFNGRPTPPTPGSSGTPEYFVLRRH